MIKWVNKLSIGDTGIEIMQETTKKNMYTKATPDSECIILSFKTIYLNQFQMLVIHIKTRRVLYTFKNY